MLGLAFQFVSADDSSYQLPAAYSQQSFNTGHYGGPSGYANGAYDERNGYITQGAEYQVQEIANNQIGNVAQQSQFDGSSVDLTPNRQLTSGNVPSDGLYGGISFDYDTEHQHQSNAFDAFHGHVDESNSSQQTIHTQAETFPISKHVEITKNVPYPVYKQLHVPGSCNRHFFFFVSHFLPFSGGFVRRRISSVLQHDLCTFFSASLIQPARKWSEIESFQRQTTKSFPFFFFSLVIVFSSASRARSNSASSVGATASSISNTYTRCETLRCASSQGNYDSDWENCAVSGGQESAIHRREACALQRGKICDRAQEGAVRRQSANRENDYSPCQFAWPLSG